MEEKNGKSFNYTYSAKQQEEVNVIRKKYQVLDEHLEKMDLLRRMDAEVTWKAVRFSVVFGIIGALVMGSGMSLLMTDIADAIGMSDMMAMIIGIVIGLVGLVLVCCAYPLYKAVLIRERARVAPKVLELTDELLL